MFAVRRVHIATRSALHITTANTTFRLLNRLTSCHFNFTAGRASMRLIRPACSKIRDRISRRGNFRVIMGLQWHIRCGVCTISLHNLFLFSFLLNCL